MTTTTHDTRDEIGALAIHHGWVLFKDSGWCHEYRRATLDEAVCERLSIFFSESRTRYVTGATYVRPTGDRTILDGTPTYRAEGLTHRDKNKVETIYCWLRHKLSVKRETNDMLVKLGYTPILETRWSLADYPRTKVNKEGA